MMIPTVDKHNTVELKKFALTMSWAIPLLFCLIIPWLFSTAIKLWPFGISAFLMAFYFVYPKGIYPFYRGWMFIASIIGWINTRLILAFVFYIMILPIGLVLRLLGKLHYKQSISDNNTTYWIKSANRTNKEDLEHPF